MSVLPSPRGEDPDDGAALSQTVRAQLRLREMILDGELAPGARIAELALVERLGASRTPIRTALARLQDEGLLATLPGGGYAVKDFSEADIRDAIEIRGTLEGLAARLAAERGVAAAVLADVHDCLDGIDALLAPAKLSERAFSQYAEQNARFHGLIAEMSGSPIVQRQLERAMTLPFASPNGFVMAHATGPRARDRLIVAHEQHRATVEAIESGEGARADALMQEHARSARHNLADTLRDRRSRDRLPGANLIRRRSAR